MTEQIPQSAFPSEDALMESALKTSFFQESLQEAIYHEFELSGYFGIPDLVVVDIEAKGGFQSTAFEMKLSNWKRALEQAFRYKAFVETVYVVMDHAKANVPLQNLDRFIKSNIGLATVSSNGQMCFHYHPDDDKPYSKRLAGNFVKMVEENTAGA